jgi:[ribosomal protein S5]-alanine N-acetyltransferase
MSLTRVERRSRLELRGNRVVLRPLNEGDFPAWHEVRTRNADWLSPWEPRSKGAPPPTENRANFTAIRGSRERQQQVGTAYAFGIFVRGQFAGEVTLSSILRGPCQNASIGYWIDVVHAGHGLVPEAVLVTLRFAFEMISLHRVEISIIPKNLASRRVVAKLGIREEGVAVRFLEINGVWEDHLRHAITAEEWAVRGSTLLAEWSVS